MTEFIIIVALVAIGAIGFVGLFGDNLRNLFGKSSGTLAGRTVTSAGKVTAPPDPHKTLATFGNHVASGSGDVPPSSAEMAPGGGPMEVGPVP